jgi:hypothetical protein
MSAVAANLKKETKLTSSGENEETFEMKYNRACYLLAQGKWEEAEKVSRGYQPSYFTIHEKRNGGFCMKRRQKTLSLELKVFPYLIFIDD